MDDLTVHCLFGLGAVFAILCSSLRRGRSLWALLAAVSTAVGILSALAAGRTLDELLALVLLVCGVSMAALLFGREQDR